MDLVFKDHNFSGTEPLWIVRETCTFFLEIEKKGIRLIKSTLCLQCQFYEPPRLPKCSPVLVYLFPLNWNKNRTSKMCATNTIFGLIFFAVVDKWQVPTGMRSLFCSGRKIRSDCKLTKCETRCFQLAFNYTTLI